MTSFKTPSEVWQALAATPPGEERAALLSEGENRSLILNSGSFVIFSNGEPDLKGKTLQEQLAPLSILQTQRLRTLRTGEVVMDGKGTFGGMSERSMRDQALTARIEVNIADLNGRTVDEIMRSPALKNQIEKMITQKDDLGLDDQGRVVVTTDLSEIALVTAARETMEEMVELMLLRDIIGKLHIEQTPLRSIFTRTAMIPIPLQNVHDDNYAINIWDGNLDKPAFTVTPFGHIATLDDDAFSQIVGPGTARMKEGLELFHDSASRSQLKGREILGLQSALLFDALKAWGSKDLSKDYRYPHEWIGVWRKAQTALGLYGQKGAEHMIGLAQEVQVSVINDAQARGETPYHLGIMDALIQMSGGKIGSESDINRFDEDFGLPAGTFTAMNAAATRSFRERFSSPDMERNI